METTGSGPSSSVSGSDFSTTFPISFSKVPYYFITNPASASSLDGSLMAALFAPQKGGGSTYQDTLTKTGFITRARAYKHYWLALGE